MASIPGWAYIIIGIAMSIMSKIVESSSKKPGNFGLFFWLGIVFIVVGVGKLIFNAVFRKGKKPAKEPTLRPAYAQQPHPQQRYHSHHAQQHQVIQNPQDIQAQPQNSSPPAHHRLVHQQFNPQTQHHVQRAQSQAQPQQHQSIVACPACNTRHYDYANYCMRCGTRIKK